jgi:hypothetical protein
MCGFFVFVWVIAGPRSSTPASADDQALSVPAVTLSVEGYYDGGKHKTSMWEFRWKGHDFITHPDGRWIIHSPACGCGWMPKAEKQR